MALGFSHGNGAASVPRRSLLFAVLLTVVALISRVWAAWALPNAEQDGYSYAEIIAQLTRHFQTSEFRLADVYGFWLPLFQFVTAGLNLFIQDALVSGKIVNVICGTISLVLVSDITRRLTGRLWTGLLAFVLL